jgi:hypothetical protein
MSDKVTSLSGPVESVDGKLVLQIPLAAGGAQLVGASRGIGVVVDDYLEVSIPDWLAQQLGIAEGSVVTVDNRDGKFNITPEPT